jgi:predicted nucleic acid-binding protein
MTGERTFVDTNVLLDAYDRSAGAKHVVARTLLRSLSDERSGLLSSQVLQEFYMNATRKLPRTTRPSRARAIIERYAVWPVHLVEPVDMVAASNLAERHSVSFWDALIVVAASRSQAARIVTEDMQHGSTLLGVTISDPFRDAVARAPDTTVDELPTPESSETRSARG